MPLVSQESSRPSPSVSAVNTYAEPELLPLSSSRQAPTMAVAPLIATETPNWSPGAPSLARSLAICRPVVVLKR